MPSAHDTTSWAGGAKHLSYPSSLTPRHTPTLISYKEQACSHPQQGANKQGNLLFLHHPVAAAVDPVNPCLNFLSVVVQSLSHVRFCEFMDATCQASLSFTISQSLLKIMSIELVILSNSSSISPLFCPQPFLASGSFPMSWLFASGGQNIGASDLASVLQMSIQC